MASPEGPLAGKRGAGGKVLPKPLSALSTGDSCCPHSGLLFLAWMLIFFIVGCRATARRVCPARTWGELLQDDKLDGALILVVEDEPLIALDISSSLKDAGAQVVQAANVDG